MEGNVINDFLLCIKRVIDIPVIDLKSNLSDLDTMTFRETVRHFTSDHTADDTVLADVVDAFVQRLNRFAVTKNRNVIRDIGDLVDLVRNDDRGHPLFFECQQQIQQCLGVLLIEGGCWLVEDHQSRIFRQGLGDLDHLLFSDADILDQGLGRLGQPYDLQIFSGLGMGLVPVDGEFSSLFVPQEHILTDAHVGHECQLLMNDDDAFSFAVLNVGELAYFSLVYDVPRITAIGIPAAEYIHQRRLPRAIFAYQGMDAALLDDEVYVVKRLDARECFCYRAHFQQGHAINPF